MKIKKISISKTFLLKSVGAVALFAVVLLNTQACGEFSGVNSLGSASAEGMSDGEIAGSSGDLLVVASNANSDITQIAEFSLISQSDGLSDSAVITWSNTIQNPLTGNNVGTCSQVASAGPLIYDVRCPQGGNVVIHATVTDGASSGQAQLTVLLQDPNAPVATPVATPPPAATPVGTSGPNAAGVALYNTNCQSCHQAITKTTINGTQPANITNALGDIGQMKGIVLTKAQIQSISDALNGK